MLRQQKVCSVLQKPRTSWDLSHYVAGWEGTEQDRNLPLGPSLTLGDEWDQRRKGSPNQVIGHLAERKHV